MKKIYPLIFCILFFIKAFSQSPVNIKKPQYLNVTQAYVYIESQESQLVAIKNKYPELDLQTKIASQEFNSNFGLAKKNMIAFLQKYYGKNYTQVENFISKEITNIVNQIEIVNKSVAEDYVADVRRKAKGSIDSPILETLLSFQYLDNPEKEFTAGFINTFKTKGHPKAKGTDWQVSIPRSWRPTEGVRPNIIQLFNSENGDGLEVITLMVKDLGLPEGYMPSQKEISELFSEKGIRNMVPSGSKFISSKKITLDNFAGGMLEIEQLIERVDLLMKLRIIQYSFYKSNKLYMLQCGIVGKQNEDLSIRLKKFLPLFGHIANSIVENEQYK